MSQHSDGPGRIPKSARTRARLVDAAVGLCLSRGYEYTTVERISAAAGVSPRTFARHFSSKDEVLLTLVDGLADAVSAELMKMDAGVPALQALCDAHAAVFRRIRSGGVPDVTVDNMVITMVVLNSAPELRVPAAMRCAGMSEAITARSGSGPGEREHELITAVFTAISASVCGDLDADFNPALMTPELVADRYEDAFRQFAELVDGLTTEPGLPDSDPPQARAWVTD